MARDYAKRRPNRRILTAGMGSSRSGKGGGSRSRSSGVLKHVPYLLVGMVLGLVIAGFFYLKMQPMQVAHREVPEEEAPAPKAVTTKKTKVAHRKKVETATATAHAKAQPHYDFYTMLTKDKNQDANEEEIYNEDSDRDEGEREEDIAPAKPQVNTAEKVTTTEEKESHPAKKTTSAAGKYVLQIASLKKQQDADRLKAKLTLEGHDVFIGKQKVNNVTYYRVYIGPYRSAENARMQQKRLKQSHINSFLVTV